MLETTEMKIEVYYYNTDGSDAGVWKPNHTNGTPAYGVIKLLKYANHNRNVRYREGGREADRRARADVEAQRIKTALELEQDRMADDIIQAMEDYNDKLP